MINFIDKYTPEKVIARHKNTNFLSVRKINDYLIAQIEKKCAFLHKDKPKRLSHLLIPTIAQNSLFCSGKQTVFHIKTACFGVLTIQTPCPKAYLQTTCYCQQAHAIKTIFTTIPRKEQTGNVLSRIFSIITFLYISLQ